jgi:peroxiredoxin
MTHDNQNIPPAADQHAPAPDLSQPAAPTPAGPGDEAARAAGRRRWILAAAAALAVALFAVPFIQGPAMQSGADGAAAGAAGDSGTCAASEGKANFDFTLKDMNGASVRLSDYKGKVVLLNFWATWCGPCKVEIPEFVEVYKEYKDRGFEILGVLAMDEPSPEELKAFADAYHMNYPVLRANQEFEDAHGPLWGLPTTFVIDRQGSICTKHMGPVSREIVEQEIKGLL